MVFSNHKKMNKYFDIRNTKKHYSLARRETSLFLTTQLNNRLIRTAGVYARYLMFDGADHRLVWWGAEIWAVLVFHRGQPDSQVSGQNSKNVNLTYLVLLDPFGLFTSHKG